MIEGFVHPGLALGAALAAVPLIIHLLNRRQHKPLAWGAMRFVRLAHERTRRRSRFENLLLLLLRMAGVALLALVLARPFTSGAGPLSALTESRRQLVLILDASASTGYRAQASSSFERIVERARELVGELDSARGDRAQIVLADASPRLLAWREPREALSILSTLDRPSDAPSDLAAALAEARRGIEDEALAAAGAELDLRLLCDLQAQLFRGPGPDSEEAGDDAPASAPDATAAAADDSPAGAPRAAWLTELDALAAAGLELIVEDLGPTAPEAPNLGVGRISPVGELAGVGLPSELRVEVFNHGSERRPEVAVRLAIDGRRLPPRTVDLPGRGRGEAVFTAVFDSPGPHLLEASLEGDRLAFDDQRAEVVDVPRAVRVLGVNGAPDTNDILADELGLFRTVLLPPEGDAFGLGAAQPFEYTETDPARLGDADLALEEFDVIVLANVEGLEVRAIQQLESRVRDGASLLITLGDRVSLPDYGRRLWREDGTGLLPAELLERVAVPSRRDAYWRIAEFDADHPALRFFAEERWKPFLTEVPVFEYVAARPAEGARVLARLDRGGDPLLIERAFGRGRLLLFTTSIDSAWTRFPESPRTLVPFTHELLRYAGAQALPPRSVELGAPLVAELERFPRSAVLVDPRGERRPLAAEPVPLPGDRWELELLTRAEFAGAYALELADSEGLPFAVGFDATEGDLARTSGAELRARHPALVPLRDERRTDSGSERDSPARGELWRLLAWITLAILIVESSYSAWLGWRRRP